MRQTARILVVDDNPHIHDDIRKTLACCGLPGRPAIEAGRPAAGTGPADPETALGFCVDAAGSGEEALRLVERALADGHPYAVAFVDVRMPAGLDGLQTIEAAACTRARARPGSWAASSPPGATARAAAPRSR